MRKLLLRLYLSRLEAASKIRNFLAFMEFSLKEAAQRGEFTADELHAIRHHKEEFIAELHQLAHVFARRKMTLLFDLKGATLLLGQANVLTPKQNCITFNLPLPKDQVVVCPNMGQVRECAAQNKTGGHHWVLSYASALSFIDQYSILGTDVNSQPSYSPEIDWFWGRKERVWAETKPIAGYYLFDMRPRWNYTDWQGQGLNIAGLGEDYVRADERVFAQVVLTDLKTTNRRLFADAWHWGCLPDSDGNRITVFADKAGFRVGYEHPSKHGIRMLYVCVARKSRDQALII